MYPSHRHRETEELYILEGSLEVHGHHLGPGDYCAALGGSVHRSASTEHGCRFLVSASEEDELLGSAEPSHRGLLFVPDGRGTWGHPETGVAVRRVAIDARFGVATVLVRMAAGSRSAVWRFFDRRDISFKKDFVRGGAKARGCGSRAPALDARARHV